ncbi:MAG: hypothetical protein CMO81_03615 [Waddliaceae bacterium]|nr:hypothetical protein [Waddliaceae bacterium]
MLIVSKLSFSHAKRTVLQNINLRLEPGKLYGLLGANGSGKSTLLKCLSGVWPAHAERLSWNEKSLLALSRREHSKLISLVPQDKTPLFDFTVRESVSMGFYPRESVNSKEEELENALKEVEIWQLRDRPVTQLSSGERQRVSIARALLTGSLLLLLDEPTVNLDPKHQVAIWRLCRRLVDKGALIVCASHDLLLCREYCDEVILMKEGQAAEAAPWKERISAVSLQEYFGIDCLPE